MNAKMFDRARVDCVESFILWFEGVSLCCFQGMSSRMVWIAQKAVHCIVFQAIENLLR